MPPPIFAHLGHWYVSLPVFMGPALLLVAALKLQTWHERRQRAEAPGRRSKAPGRHSKAPAGHSKVAVSSAEGRTVLAVSGPLDYPALLEIEVELGRADAHSGELLLDLRDLTRAEPDSAWHLCDVIGRGQASGRPVSAILSRAPTMSAVREALAAEGVQTEVVASPHPVSS